MNRTNDSTAMSPGQTPFFASAAVLLAVYGVPIVVAAALWSWDPSEGPGFGLLAHLLIGSACGAFSRSSNTRVDTAKIVRKTLVACLIFDTLATVCIIGLSVYVMSTFNF